MEIDLYPWDAGTDSGITYMVSLLDGNFLIVSQFSDRAIENVLLPTFFVCLFFVCVFFWGEFACLFVL